MMTNEEKWEVCQLEQVEARRGREERGRDTEIRQMDVRAILLPALTPRPAIGQRINARYERYREKLACPQTRSEILWKVARAVEEGRVSEAAVEGIFPRLENASNRGAYFTACVKGAFLAVSLSWKEEEWTDA